MSPLELPRVHMDKERWSEESRRSIEYDFPGEYYEDIPFKCWSCGADSVFTAEQQKYTFEVKKAYIWARHTLCATCHEKRKLLLQESSALLEEWAANKPAFARNLARARRWKEVLEALPNYGVRKDAARIRMLSKVLENAT